MHSERHFAGFNRNPRVEGIHAFLSPSNYHWLGYTEDKLVDRLTVTQAAALGTRLHAWAAEAISLGRRQPDNGDVLCMYINDALNYGMTPEQTLFYSFNCFGTADTICFDELVSFLRIHDYKSGVSPTSEKQLYVYAALFCLEYGYAPFEINGELRIYQGDEVKCWTLDRDFLAEVYSKIVTFDRIIEEQKRMRGQA